MSTHLPLATSAASIGEGYPFRKNPRFDAMRRTGIFSCWEFPKPFYFPLLNIPFEKRLLLHFALHYIQRRIFDFAKATREIFMKSSLYTVSCYYSFDRIYYIIVGFKKKGRV